MKKFFVVAVAVCLAVMMAVPAMATDVNFSGTYRVRGFWMENMDLTDTSADDAYMDHRLRLTTKFTVNDILSVTTRWDILETNWGTFPETAGAPQDVDVDRVWMTINMPDWSSKFDIGRMSGGAWGTSFIDVVGHEDRIKWTYTGIDNFTLLAIYRKAAENDGATYGAGATQTYVSGQKSDEDFDVYYAAFVYKQETWNAGFLYGFLNNQGVSGTKATTHAYIPYFKANFGPIYLQGEFRYNDGDNEVDGAADTDVEQMAANLEGTYDFGPAKLMLGWAFLSGEDRDPQTVSNYAGTGADWAYPLYILTGNDGGQVGNLGGVGNLSGAHGGGGTNLFYAGFWYDVMENMTIGATVGFAEADDVSNQAAGTDDDQGSELDLLLDWKIFDNLNYHFCWAFYNAGEYWRDVGGIAPANFDDAQAIWHSLTLSF
jgi:hypothetical protein